MKKEHIMLASALLGLILLCLPYAGTLATSQDIQIYNRIGGEVQQARSAPPTDTMESEYPPLAGFVFFLIQDNPWKLPFATGWMFFLLAAFIAAVSYAWIRLSPSESAILAGITLASALFLGSELTFARFDIILLLLLFLAWRAHEHDRLRDCGFFLACAASLKLVPVLLWPVFFFATSKHSRKALVEGLIAGGMVSLLLPLLVLGVQGYINNVRYMLSYHGNRGIQIESTWASIHMLWENLAGRKVPTSFVAMSVVDTELGVITGKIATLLTLAGVCFLSWVACVRERRHRAQIGPLLCATLAWILWGSPVLSPQYMLWILPLVLGWCVLRMQHHSRIDATILTPLGLAAVAAFCTVWIFPLHYGAFMDQSSPLHTLILVLRNLSILGIAVVFWYGPERLRRKTGPAPQPRRKRISWNTQVTVALVGVALSLACGIYANPQFGPVTYRFDEEQTEQEGNLPLFVQSKGEYIHVRVPIILSPIHPSVFQLKPDDCIESLFVNGNEVTDPEAHFCDYASGQPVDLGAFLRIGKNLVHVTIKDTGGLGGINMTVAARDPMLMLLRLLLILSLLWLAIALRRFLPRGLQSPAALWALLTGCLIRFLYVVSTPHGLRGHDTDAHIDYIRYVATHLRMPPAVDGWEFHQPPLYYFLAGLWMRMQEAWGRASAVLLDIQKGSLILSLFTLACGAWVGMRMLHRPADKKLLPLFIALLAFFPSLVFVASRITNDALYTPLAFLFLALLVEWWQKGNVKVWYAMIATLGLLLITKLNALVLVPVPFVCLLVRERWHSERLWKQGAVSVALIILLAGWVPMLRLLEQEPTRSMTLGNQGMSGQLAVPQNADAFLTFSPRQILEHPFNQTWDDSQRRQYFWEFYFKSAFFGEFTFPDSTRGTAVTILLFGLLSLPLLLLGLAKALLERFSEHLPLLLSFAFLLASSLAYRVRFAYAPNQDFRFVVLLAALWAYFAVLGAISLKDTPRRIASIVLWGWAASCGAFLLMIPVA